MPRMAALQRPLRSLLNLLHYWHRRSKPQTQSSRANQSISVVSPHLTNSGTTITETTSICATLATQFPEARLWTKDLADAIEVTLLGSMQQLTSTDPTSIGEALKTINETLLFSMHPVKYAFTVADLCLWGAIKANPLLSTEISSGNYIEIERWYKELMESQPITTKVYKFVKDLTAVLHP